MRKEMKMYHQMQEDEIERQKDQLREIRPGFHYIFISIFYIFFFIYIRIIRKKE